MIQSEGLSGADLVAAFVERRISPLQSRPHMMCQMSGRFNPSRLSTRPSDWIITRSRETAAFPA